MLSSVLNFLRKTKDKRLKFNFVGGSFLLIFLMLSTVIFFLFRIIDMSLEVNLAQYNFNIFLTILLGLISFHFARLNYYWYYQKDEIEHIFKDDATVNRSEKVDDFLSMTLLNRINYISLLVSDVSKFFGISIIVSYVLVKKTDLPYLGLIIVILVFFLSIFQIKKMFFKTDFNMFKNLYIKGIMTEYSKSFLVKEEELAND